MGRHARGAFRSGFLARSVAVLVGTGAVVAVGLGLGSGVQPASTTAPAMVVSSLACTDGAGGTVVDVVAPTATSGGGQVRADLDACGYREGQQLQVQFVPGDPTQVVLAGNESATDFLTGDGLPFALWIAVLLALGAALAIWLDARRVNGWSSVVGLRRAAGHAWRRRPAGLDATPRRAGSHEVVDADESIDADRVVDADYRLAAAQPALVWGLRSGAPTGDGPVVLPVPRTGRHALPELPEMVAMDRVDDPDPSLSSVDLTFPYSSSLAACLHDELFTHRSRTG